MINKFLDYLEYEKKYSKHTIVAYKNDLYTFRDFCELEYEQDIIDTHYNQIRTWVVQMVEEGISNRSVNRKISSLKGFYKFLLTIGEIDKNPLSKHRPLKIQKKIQVPFAKQEVEKVLNTNFQEQDKFTALRNKLIVELLYSTGMRRAELINIKHQDINLYDDTIKIFGKRSKERLVSILPSVKQTISDYLKEKEQYEKDRNFLLITKKGEKIYETLVYRIINSYFSSVSTKQKKSPHMLRHTFATHLLNEGADLNSVKELLGHSSLESTQIYTHNSLEKLKKVFNQTHPRKGD